MFVQVWGSLVSNVISVLIGLAGVAYTCWLLAECPPSDRFCDRQSFIEFKDVEGLRRKCSQNVYMLNVSLSLSGLQGRTLGAPQIWSRGLPWAQEQVVLCVYFLFHISCFRWFFTGCSASSWFSSSCRPASPLSSVFSLAKPSGSAHLLLSA